MTEEALPPRYLEREKAISAVTRAMASGVPTPTTSKLREEGYRAESHHPCECGGERIHAGQKPREQQKPGPVSLEPFLRVSDEGIWVQGEQAEYPQQARAHEQA
jgi:hypothetical protein